MSNTNFHQVCDYISKAVDSTQFERFRWDRDEAPKLARLIELVTSSFAERSDIDLAEEGASSGLKRYVLKVHSQRTIAISVALKNGQAVIGAETLERSPYSVAAGEPISTDYDNVDEKWISDTLQSVMSRIGKVN